jgi:sigma-E factor negative regulatory protein RseC
MAITTGNITQVNNGSVEFSMEQTSACASCKLRAGCGQGMVAKKTESQMARIQVPVENIAEGCPIQEGPATLEVDDTAISFGVLVGYIIPIVALVLGALLGDHLFETELAAIGFALLGFLLGMLNIKRLNAKHKNSRWLQPRIVSSSD